MCWPSVQAIGAQPHKCPVCQGSGVVPSGFYLTGYYGSSSTSGASPEKCRACDGNGVLKSSMIFRNIMAQRRKDLGLSQEYVALETNLQQWLISRLESGGRKASLDEAVAIAKCLGFSLRELELRIEGLS